MKDKLIWALESFPVELAALFGSAARGEDRGGSDVDVGVRLTVDTVETRRRLQAALPRRRVRRRPRLP